MRMQIAVAQLDQVIGDLSGNAAAILDATREAQHAGARLVITPELSLPGYPPEDLLLRPAFIEACARELGALAAAVTDVPVLVGFPERADGICYNALAVLRDGRVDKTYRKQCLPNYTVFDEERYFEPGIAPCVIDVDGLPCGLIICEDVWFPEPIRQAKEPLELAEERRLLYVGITRARRSLWLSWATSRVGSSGREGRRSRSRFLDGLVPPSARRVRPSVAVGPGTGTQDRPGKVDPADRSPLSNALRAWRTARAKTDAVAPFIVFHDSTIEAIAERRPRSIADLRRIPGVGPTKLDRYGEEIIAVVVSEA